MSEFTLHSLDELAAFAEHILSLPPASAGATVIGLEGELGAGKTTFVQSIAAALNIEATVMSPTFLIMKRYAILGHEWYGNLIHIDAYRIEEESELALLGFKDECLRKENLIVVEWADRVKGLLPEDSRRIFFTVNADGSRNVRYEENGTRKK